MKMGITEAADKYGLPIKSFITEGTNTETAIVLKAA